MSEHTRSRNSPARRILSTGGTLQEHKRLVTSPSSKHGTVLGMCLCAAPRCDRSEFTSDYSLLLAAVIQLMLKLSFIYASMEKRIFDRCDLSL